jgi:hypothetical protein
MRGRAEDGQDATWRVTDDMRPLSLTAALTLGCLVRRNERFCGDSPEEGGGAQRLA